MKKHKIKKISVIALSSIIGASAIVSTAIACSSSSSVALKFQDKDGDITYNKASSKYFIKLSVEGDADSIKTKLNNAAFRIAISNGDSRGVAPTPVEVHQQDKTTTFKLELPSEIESQSVSQLTFVFIDAKGHFSRLGITIDKETFAKAKQKIQEDSNTTNPEENKTPGEGQTPPDNNTPGNSDGQTPPNNNAPSGGSDTTPTTPDKTDTSKPGDSNQTPPANDSNGAGNDTSGGSTDSKPNITTYTLGDVVISAISSTTASIDLSFTSNIDSKIVSIKITDQANTSVFELQNQTTSNVRFELTNLKPSTTYSLSEVKVGESLVNLSNIDDQNKLRFTTQQQTQPTQPKPMLNVVVDTDDNLNFKEQNSGFDSQTQRPRDVSPLISWTAVEGASHYAVVIKDFESIPVTGEPTLHLAVANIKTTSLKEDIVRQNDEASNSLVFVNLDDKEQNKYQPVGGDGFDDDMPPPSQPNSDRNAAQTPPPAPQAPFIKFQAFTPPNKPHFYEVVVYALRNEFNDRIKNDKDLTFDKFEKALNDAFVISSETKYIIGRQIKVNGDDRGFNPQLQPPVAKPNSYFFKDNQNPTEINNIVLKNLSDYIVTAPQDQTQQIPAPQQTKPQFTFNDTNPNAKSYMVVVSSAIPNRNTGITVHYAAIFSKDESIADNILKLNNSYTSYYYIIKYNNASPSGFQNDDNNRLKNIINDKFAVLKEETNDQLLIQIYGVDEEYASLVTKFHQLGEQAQRDQENPNPRYHRSLANGLDAIANKVVSYGTVFKSKI